MEYTVNATVPLFPSGNAFQDLEIHEDGHEEMKEDRQMGFKKKKKKKKKNKCTTQMRERTQKAFLEIVKTLEHVERNEVSTEDWTE